MGVCVSTVTQKGQVAILKNRRDSCLIGQSAIASGCEYILTFDKTAAKASAFKNL